MEQLKSELQREKQVREEEVSRYKDQVTRMQNELEDAGIAIGDIKGDSAKQKQIIDSLQVELYKARQTAELMASQVSCQLH